MKVHVRERTKDDHNTVSELFNEGASDLYDKIGYRIVPTDADQLEERGGDGLVALVDNRVVGTVSYRIRGDRMHLTDLVVNKAHRGLGVARALIDELIRMGRAARARKLTVQTVAEAGAEKMFEHLGFRTHSTKREFIFGHANDSKLTTIYMVLSLKERSY